MRPIHAAALLWLVQAVTVFLSPSGVGVGWVLLTAVLLGVAARRPHSWWVAVCMAWQGAAAFALVAGLVTVGATTGRIVETACQVGLLGATWLALSPRHTH